jgi:putative toxin-antitoxin system antitoxin component (TIGR02293 family)
LEVAGSTSARKVEGVEPVLAAAELLGGKSIWKRPPTTKMEVHEAILEGIPGRALKCMISHVHLIPADLVWGAIGISHRTVQRYSKEKTASLDQAQGARLWKFAEILAAAIELQGSQEAGEEWLKTPQMALDQKTPLEMMKTTAGAEMVQDLLIQLDHGVYP